VNSKKDPEESIYQQGLSPKELNLKEMNYPEAELRGIND